MSTVIDRGRLVEAWSGYARDIRDYMAGRGPVPVAPGRARSVAAAAAPGEWVTRTDRDTTGGKAAVRRSCSVRWRSGRSNGQNSRAFRDRRRLVWPHGGRRIRRLQERQGRTDWNRTK